MNQDPDSPDYKDTNVGEGFIPSREEMRQEKGNIIGEMNKSLDEKDEEITRLKALGGEWIPIEKGLPEFGRLVYLFENGRIYFGERFDEPEGWLWARYYQVPEYYDGKWQGDPESDDDYKPTHWMHLPEPPII
jgi:hypothetical protein